MSTLAIMVAFSSLLLMPVSTLAAADTCTWTGANSGSWSDGGNWVGCDNGGVPEDGDSLVFPAGASNIGISANDIAGTLDVDSITISGSNYLLSGNPVYISSYLQFTGNNNTVQFGAIAFTNASTGTSLVVDGTGNTIPTSPISLNMTGGDDFNVYANQDFTLSDVSGVTGNFNKWGSGTLTTSTSASTFGASGAVNIFGGSYVCRNANCAGGSANDIQTQSTGTLVLDGASINQVNHDIILGSTASPQLNMLPGNVTINGNISVNTTGTIYAQTGTLTINGDVLLDGNDLYMLTSSTTNATIEQDNGSVISDSGSNRSFNVIGGRVVLNGNNTYTGVTNVSSSAVLAVRSTSGLGSTSGNTVVSSGGSLVFDETSDQTIDAEPITISGNGAGGNYDGAIVNIDNSRTLTGPITLAASSALSTRNTASLTVNSAIGGTGDVTIESTDPASFVIFDGSTPNTYVGTTYVNDAHLSLVKDTSVVAVPGDLVVDATAGLLSQVQANGGEQIADNSSVVMSETNLLQAQIQIGDTETVGSIAGAGSIAIIPGETLTTGGNNSSTTFAGRITSQAIVPFGVLNKVGSGTLTLTGSTAIGFEPTLVVNGGSLVVNSNFATVGTTVNTNSSLKGSGSIGATTINSGGTINAGNSPGCMTVATLNLTSGSNFDQEIAGSAACTGYDQTTVTGAANLNNATLNIVPSYTPTSGQIFTIVSAGSITGQFNNLPDNSEIVVNGLTFRINYTGTTVTLTYISGTLAATGQNSNSTALIALGVMSLALAGLGMEFASRRRRENV